MTLLPFSDTLGTSVLPLRTPLWGPDREYDKRVQDRGHTLSCGMSVHERPSGTKYPVLLTSPFYDGLLTRSDTKSFCS